MARALAPILAVVLVACTCPSKRRAGPTPDAGNSVSDETRARDLVDEAPRAELDINGLFINLGTPDQHKYIWPPRWGRRGEDGRRRFLEARDGARLFFLDTHGGARTIRLRVRSRGATRMAIVVDGTLLGETELGDGWEVVSWSLKKPLPAGRRDVVLHFAGGAGTDAVRANVDWVWLGAGSMQRHGPLDKTGTGAPGPPRRALIADPPRAFHYYVEVPQGATLGFSYGATLPVTFRVTAARDGAAPRQLFRTRVGDSRWHDARVPLDDLAGEVVRLSLATTGQAGEAAWSDTEIVVRGKPGRAPTISPSNAAQGFVHVVLDAARQDHYRVFNRSTAVRTPAFTKFAKRSVVFSQAYTPSSFTKFSMGSMLTGMFTPAVLTEDPGARLPSDLTLLSEHLGRQGFKTALFTSSPVISIGLRDRGWDHVAVGFSWTSRDLFDRAISWIRRHRRDRFYVYIHSMETHEPYRRRPECPHLYVDPSYRGPLKDGVKEALAHRIRSRSITLNSADRAQLRGLYAQGITAHDQNFGRFIKTLGDLKILDRVLVAFSSDHGEELLERGQLGHGHSLHEEMLLAPFLLRYPAALPPGRVVREVVELLDLVPTVTELLGVAPLPGAHGLSLLGTVHCRPPFQPPLALAEHGQIALRTGRYKMIRAAGRLDEKPTGGVRLYDLARDPDERRDVSASRPVAHRALELLLAEGVAIPAKAKRLRFVDGNIAHRTERGRDLSSELRRQLRGLGYITLPAVAKKKKKKKHQRAAKPKPPVAPRPSRGDR